jgi:hypothetical protein
MIRSYNAVMGPFWHQTVFKLLDVLNIVFKAWIPLWNTVVVYFYQITQGYLLPVMIRETAIMINPGNSILSLGETFSYFSFVWIRQLIVECPLSSGDASVQLRSESTDFRPHDTHDPREE